MIVSCPHCGGLVSRDIQGGSTPLQSRVLDFIREYVARRNGVSPTYREIGGVLGMTAPNVHRVVKCLEARGKLVTDYGRARSIVLMEAS